MPFGLNSAYRTTIQSCKLGRVYWVGFGPGLGPVLASNHFSVWGQVWAYAFEIRQGLGLYLSNSSQLCVDWLNACCRYIDLFSCTRVFILGLSFLLSKSWLCSWFWFQDKTKFAHFTVKCCCIQLFTLSFNSSFRKNWRISLLIVV